METNHFAKNAVIICIRANASVSNTFKSVKNTTTTTTNALCQEYKKCSSTSTQITHLPPTSASRRHPPNDRGVDKCAVQSWAAVHGEIEIMSTKSFINKDKYKYLDSSLKHAQIYTRTCLMVLHSQVQQSPGSHFAVVDSGTSIHILQYRLFTSNLSEDHTVVSGFSGNTSRATRRGDSNCVVRAQRGRLIHLVDPSSPA